MKLRAAVLRVSKRCREAISFSTSSIGRKDEAVITPLNLMKTDRWNQLLAYAIIAFPIGITMLSMSYGVSKYDSMTDDKDDIGWPTGDWY